MAIQTAADLQAESTRMQRYLLKTLLITQAEKPQRADYL